MAVKKHELAPENRSQMDIDALAQYIQILTVDTSYLPPPLELIKYCQDIVKCLARTEAATGGSDPVYQKLQTVEDFYMTLVNGLGNAFRKDLITAVLEKFHALISDPQSDAAPAASIVLVVFEGSSPETMVSAARWLVQQVEHGPAGAGLRASLTCLYRWACDPNSSHHLGNWIRTFIRALEDNDSFDILIEVTMDNIERMFLLLKKPSELRESIADVLFHVMASMRESHEAFDKIAAHVGDVLVILATESGAWSRQLLQNVVDILTAYVDSLSHARKDKYHAVILCLEQHMASRGCRYLQLPAWIRLRERRADNASPVSSLAATKKVGLLNLGNTCYMNSVMQALLVTRQFSSHVVLNKDATPYWQKVGILFAKMMHSLASSLNPDDIFASIKPPFFTMETQHDSSEFLGYLFELLHTYEHVSDKNFDYSKPLLPGPGRNLLQPPIVPAAPSLDCDNSNEGCSRRSMSPRPGTSRAGSSSGNKRPSPGRSVDVLMPPKKRSRALEPQYVRPNNNSFIDNLFAGVLLTRLECTECHRTSLSRDGFRDIQLAFPEKPEPGKQHSVQSLLEYYCSKERLSGENRYHCRDCGGKKDAERSVVIESPPKFLILVLKHFKFEAKRQQQTKLLHSVHYNHSISLPIVRAQGVHATYTIYAAVIHNGTTLDSGHYYTLAKDNDQWHFYNDEVVSNSHESELNQLTNCSTPYILFYRRTDIEELTMPSMQEMPEKVQEVVQGHNKHYIDQMNKLRCARP